MVIPPFTRVLTVTTGLFIAQTIFACTWESHYRKGLRRFVPLSIIYPIYYWIIVVPSFVMGVWSALLAHGRNSATWERTARVSTSPTPTQTSA